MNVCQMEEEARVNRYVQIPLDHSPAAVSQDTLCLDIPALVIQLFVSTTDVTCLLGSICMHFHPYIDPATVQIPINYILIHSNYLSRR